MDAIFEIFAGNGFETNSPTFEGDYAFIYRFIDILRELFNVILGFINGLGAGGTTKPEGEGTGTGTEA